MAILHWKPTEQDIDNSGLEEFRKYLNKRYNTDFKRGDYWTLQKWTVANPETINQFWEAIWDWGGMIGDRGPSPVSFVVRCWSTPADGICSEGLKSQGTLLMLFSLRNLSRIYSSLTPPCRCTRRRRWRGMQS